MSEEIQINIITDTKTKNKIYNKNYYQKNKERILTSMSKDVVCPICQKLSARSHLNRHQQSMKCQQANKINEV